MTPIPDDDLARYMATEFSDQVLRTSAQRLANPLPFALEALEDLFRHESDKEVGFRRFRRKLEAFIFWADDAVHCLERVLVSPPDHLGELVRSHAGVVTWVDGPHGELPGDDDVHEAWLRETVPRLRAMLDDYIAERRVRRAP